MELKKLSLISLGGIAGSLSRWAMSLWVVDPSFPWATLLVNYLGSIALTALVVVAKHHQNPRWWWRPTLGTGFCGGFTTYSAFAVKIDQEIRLHNYHGVISYALASLIGTFILVFITYELLDKRLQKKTSR